MENLRQGFDNPRMTFLHLLYQSLMLILILTGYCRRSEH